ncbi:anti-sigma factor domain-containing protein [Sphingomonas abaci]|uniref:Anti-sigma-K factor RskA n=1 Tax=Sphingomonas abaci TaxID=237611 RepID=A0A7W7AJL9_9SPHN|nr:anti-sigma-K factor RskA [Sphingomonas abaci]
MTDDPDLQAAELALGVLDGEERAAALRRVLAEPAFAAEVERWRLYFAQLFDLWPEVEPPEELIERIDASLGGPGHVRTRRAAPWPLIAIASSALAACLLVILLLRPAPEPAAPSPTPVASATAAPSAPAAGPTLIAMLGDGRTPIAAAYDGAAGRLRVASQPATPRGRVAQLWVIGGDATPHPLGLLGPDGLELVLAPADRARLVAGATLAISIEPPGGSPTSLPTGPVVATGALSRV